MATKTWVGTTSDWRAAGNWSPSGEPVAGDDLVFNSGSSQNTTFDRTRSFNSVTTTGYTGTITICSSCELQVTSTFTHGSGATIQIDGSLSIRSAVTIITNNGSITGSGNFEIEDNLNTVKTLAGSGNYNNLYILIGAGIGTPGILLTNDLTVNGTFSLINNRAQTATFSPNNNNIVLQGDLVWGGTSQDNTDWTKGTGTITLSGTAAQSIDFNGESVEEIVVDKSAGTATLSGAVTTDSLAVDRGTFDINGQAVNVIGNVTANPIAGNFSFQDSVGTGTLSIGGNINLNGTPTFGGIWTDVDIVALAPGANDASYCEISNSNNSSGNDIDATNNCVDNGGNIGWVFAGAPAVDVNPVTELLEIITPPVTVQYFPFINVDVQTETLLISTPPVNVEVFEDTTVIPATQFLNIITPPVDVNIGFDVDVNPLTEFLDIATPRVDVKTPVEFLIATEAQPLQYQVAIGGIVQMRAQLNVNAWRNENNWVSTPFPAVISTQPVGGSVTPGGAVSLSVTAIGAASYQWYLDGAALIGETGSTLNTTAPVIPGDYDYTCLALNADGFGVRSDAATVTVLTA